MLLYEFYIIHDVTVLEMKVREGTLIKHEKVSDKVVSKINKMVKEGEQRDKTWEENMHRINNVVALSCNNFVDEGITE